MRQYFTNLRRRLQNRCVGFLNHPVYCKLPNYYLLGLLYSGFTRHRCESLFVTNHNDKMQQTLRVTSPPTVLSLPLMLYVMYIQSA